MLFVVVQLIPWTVLTFLLLQSYLKDRSVEKKHLLWVHEWHDLRLLYEPAEHTHP